MLPTIITAIIGVIIGFFIGQFFKNKSDKNWKELYKTANADLSSTSKLHKKADKKSKQLSKQKTMLEQRIKDTEAKYIPLNKDLEDQLKLAKMELEEKIGSYKKIELNQTRLEQKIEQYKKEIHNLKETYANDLKDSKGWKNTRGMLNNEIAKLENVKQVLQKENRILKLKLEEQQSKVEAARASSQALKNIKSTNRKLTKDLQYWEQKHYDTHHELAQSLTKIESLEAANKDVDLRFKGSEIQKEEMMKKIEEFKTKFVNVNNLYHELKAKKESLN